MAAPNIEMIEKSLRNFSVSDRRSRSRVRSPPVRREESVEVLVELNSEVALPCNWEQCLDMRILQLEGINFILMEEQLGLELRSLTRTPHDHTMGTGEVYYKNWATGKRTTEDPRLTTTTSSYCSSSSLDEESSDDDDDDDDDDDSSNEVSGDKYFSGDCSSASSSSTYEVNSAEVESARSQVLVAAGCRHCFMFFMVPKHDFSCPKCGCLLLYLGHNG